MDVAVSVQLLFMMSHISLSTAVMSFFHEPLRSGSHLFSVCIARGFARKLDFLGDHSTNYFYGPLFLTVTVRLKSTGSRMFRDTISRAVSVFSPYAWFDSGLVHASVYGFGEFHILLRENGPRILTSTRSPLTLAVACAWLVLLVTIQFALCSPPVVDRPRMLDIMAGMAQNYGYASGFAIFRGVFPRCLQAQNALHLGRYGSGVRGLYIAMGQYSSLCEGAAVISLDAVDIGEEVQVRVQLE